MSMTAREIAALAVVLTRNGNVGLRENEIASDVLALRRLAARALSRSVRMCNDSTYTEAKQERDAKSILKAVNAVLDADRYNILGVSLGGDPRGGSCLKIKFADGSTNSFGETGWAL
jgi:hypothetical protein